MAIHLVYFENAGGQISLPPTTDCPTPCGYERREANTLAEVDRLQQRLEQAARDRSEQELAHDEETFAAARQRVYDNLYQRMISAACDEYERTFIKLYLQLRYEKREQYRKRFVCDRAYFVAREYEHPNQISMEKLEKE